MDKEELYKYFIIENHSRKDTANYFNVTESQLKRMLNKFGIKKDHKLASKNNKAPSWNKGLKKERAISRDVLISEYIEQNKSRADIASLHNVSEVIIKNLLSEYDIKKPKSLSIKLRNKTVYKQNTFEESIKRVPKDELIKYYIDENHSRLECCDHFKVTMNNLKSIISTYEIVKDRDLVKDTVFRVMMDKYGVATGFDVNDASNNGKDSKPNLEFEELLNKSNIDHLREQYVGHFRYDFKVGDVYIEINPSITHNIDYTPYGNGDPISKDYHKLKSQNVNRCIHVWDWDNKDAIIKLLLDRETIYARQCNVKEVNKEDAKQFISTHHVQGYANDAIRIGLYYKDELVSIMTFNKPRYNKNYEYELVRYCSSLNIIGGAEKLFKHFVNIYNPNGVISYCDLSKFNGHTYEKLGFKLERVSTPAIHWINLKTKQHFTDNLLRQRGVDQLLGTEFGKGSSNSEIMLDLGFVRVYDCGQATYVY